MKADNVVVMGRLVVLERGRGMASNYDCDFCCCVLQPSSISVSPSSISSLPGDTGSFTARAQTIDCNGNPRFFNATASCTWSSSNTNVAVLGSLSGSGQLVQAVGPGTARILADYSFPNLVVQPGTRCICEPDGTSTDLIDAATCDVHALASFNIVVESTPVPSEVNSVVSGQSAQINVQAIDNFGGVFNQYTGTVHFSSSDTSATLPADYAFTAPDNGAHMFSITLKTVAGVSPTRDLTVRDIPSGVNTTQWINVWFQVRAALQFYENCDGFTSGAYYNGTACLPPQPPQNSVFVALPDQGSVPCGTSIRIRNQSGGTLVQTSTKDRGPGPLGRLWWNTGAVPTDLSSMCVSDGVALALGQTFVNGGAPGPNRFGCPQPIPNNPPNSAFGEADIYLRFGP